MSTEIILVCPACKPTLEEFLMRARQAQGRAQYAESGVAELKASRDEAWARLSERDPYRVLVAMREAVWRMSRMLTYAAGMEYANESHVTPGGVRDHLREAAKEAEAFVARMKEIGL